MSPILYFGWNDVMRLRGRTSVIGSDCLGPSTRKDEDLALRSHHRRCLQVPRQIRVVFTRMYSVGRSKPATSLLMCALFGLWLLYILCAVRQRMTCKAKLKLPALLS